MENQPLISIILPVYNGEEFLAKAIDSCLNQTYRNFELIIVNDSSTDNSLSIVLKYQALDQRIIVINNSVNSKLPASLNIGHNMAKGDFITWTSDDNILKQNFLQRLYESLILKSCDIIYSDFDIIWANGTFKREQISGPSVGLLFGNVVGASFLYKKEVYKRLGGYRQDLFLAEDYHFFLMASLHYKFCHLNENLYQYRIHSRSLSSQIHSNKNFNLSHSSAVSSMFKELGAKIDMAPITANFLTNLYFGKSTAFHNYIKNKDVIVADTDKYYKATSTQDPKSLLKSLLRNRIRGGWMSSKEFTLKDLALVLLKDWKLFIGNPINYRSAGRLLYNSLRN